MNYTRTIRGNQGLIGSQGPQGYQGLNSVYGAQGTQGVQIFPGPDGLYGLQGFTHEGIQGYQGNQGTPGSSASLIGSQGAQGIQGDAADGVQGYDGWQGLVDATPTRGSQGSQANIGPQGFQGSTNIGGVVGIQGPQGSQAAAGNTGIMQTGFDGYKGEDIGGAQGGRGLQGLNQGAQGNQGSSGTQGWQGQGNQGYTGRQGWQGQITDPEIYFEFYDDFVTTDIGHNWMANQQSGSGGLIWVASEYANGNVRVYNNYGGGVVVLTPCPINIGLTGLLTFAQQPYLECKANTANASTFAISLIGFVSPPTNTSGGVYGGSTSSISVYAVFVADATQHSNWLCKVKYGNGTVTTVVSNYSTSTSRILAIRVANNKVYFYIDDNLAAELTVPTTSYLLQPRIASTEIGTQLYAQIDVDYFYLRANRQ